MQSKRYKKASSRIAKRRKVKETFGLILKIILPTAFLVGIIFISRVGFLQIKDFKIQGAETLSAENIKDTALKLTYGKWLFFVPKSNIVLFNKDKLAAALMANFSRIEKVEVNKQFFSESIELSLTERKANFLWCSRADECFFMTEDGLVFEKSVNVGDKIIFRGVLVGDPLMKNFATPQEMQKYLSLVDAFKNSKIIVTEINIESADKAIAKTDMGDIILDPKETDLSISVQNAILLINEVKSKNPSARFDYIDTRFGNKMFYKLY